MRIQPCLALLLPLLGLAHSLDLVRADERPNILFILADDLGMGDLGCYEAGSKIPTPALDQLAREGIRFTEAYCPVSVCSPTRYALLTGRYPWRSWKKQGVLANWDKPMIADDTATLSGLLQKSGYHTVGVGKWHLGATYPTLDGEPPLGRGKFKSENTGANLDLSAPISGGPLDRGFDEWFGFICASEQFVFEGNEPVAVLGHDLYQPPPAPGAETLRTIPLPDYLREMTDRCTRYLDGRKDDDQPFFLYYAPYVPHIPLAIEKQFLGSTDAGEYGDYVHELDHYIGTILDALNRNGLTENTIVIFASDNGSQFPKTETGHLPNAPYAGTKWMIREGGVRTPMLVRWPRTGGAGTIAKNLCGLNDWTATIADLLGLPLPESALDSRSFLPVLRGEPAPLGRESIALQSSSGVFAIRKGKWKYVAGSGDGRKRPEPGESQLYDLEADPREKTNLAENFPNLVKELKAELKSLTRP